MRCTLASLFMAVLPGVAFIPAAALAQQKTDDQLVQYVQYGKNAGENQSQVQQQAVKAGWPEAAVKDVVARVYGTSSGTSSGKSSGTSNPALASAAAPASRFNAGQQPESGAPLGPAMHSDNTPRDTSNTKTPLTAAPVSAPTPSAGRPAGKVSGTAPPVPYEYRIGAGDVLQVSVWKEPEASAGNVLVRPDGMISTPLTKEIHVAGLTPSQAEKAITEKLVKLIEEPEVTVVVSGMASKKIYAVGAVKREGPIPYTYSMTVMQAIAEAGGLTDYAKRSKIYVLRNDNGKESRFPFRYDDILKGEHMELNIPLLPGDTLVVPH